MNGLASRDEPPVLLGLHRVVIHVTSSFSRANSCCHSTGSMHQGGQRKVFQRSGSISKWCRVRSWLAACLRKEGFEEAKVLSTRPMRDRRNAGRNYHAGNLNRPVRIPGLAKVLRLEPVGLTRYTCRCRVFESQKYPIPHPEMITGCVAAKAPNFSSHTVDA